MGSTEQGSGRSRPTGSRHRLPAWESAPTSRCRVGTPATGGPPHPRVTSGRAPDGAGGLGVRGAGEGHAWGCAAPALCPAGGRAGRGEWSPRRMRLAAGADAATTPSSARGRAGRGSPLTHRARNPARGPVAAAPMPGAGERLQRVRGSERKRPPTRGRGGGGGESRRRATRRASSRGHPVRRWRASSRSPGSLVSRPFAAETRPALARWPLAALPPPSAKPGQGTSRNSQFLESWRRPGSPGWVRRRRVGFGRGRET